MAASPTSPSATLHLIPLSSPVLEAWFSGAYTSVYAIVLWLVVYRNNYRYQKYAFVAVLSTMFVAATVHAALDWWYLINAFVNHGATPEVVDSLAHSPVWYKATGACMFALNVLIADCVFIWRSWEIWGRNWRVTVVPILATIAGTVLAVLSIIGQVNSALEHSPGAITKRFVKFSTPYFALSLATSLLTAILIAVRVIHTEKIVLVENLFPAHGHMDTNALFSWRRVRKVLLVEVPVESAAIYSANLIVFVALTVQRNAKLSYPQNIHPHVAGIAVALIFARETLRYSGEEHDYTTYTNENGAQNGQNGSHTVSNTASDASLLA